jgi:hypothetical protein
MNIFDFENRVRSASNKQHHHLDIDSLLHDLNLVEAPKRKIGYLPYLGVLALAITGALVYFNYSVKYDNTALLTHEISSSTEVNVTTPVLKSDKILAGTKSDKKRLDAEDKKISANQESKSDLGKLTKTQNIANARIENKKFIPNEIQISKTTNNSNIIGNTETIQTVNSGNDQSIQQTNLSTLASDKVIANTNVQEQKSNVFGPDALDSEALFALPQNSTLLAVENPKSIGFRTLNKKVSDCPKFSEGNWNLAIVPEAGILIPIKSLNLQDNAYQEIFNDRDRNESSQLSYHTGIGIQFRNKITGLYIRPGFNYSIVNETFTNEDTRFVTNEVQYQLHQFNIPIAIGTSFEQDKFSLDLEGGINFNFLQKTNGRLFNGGDDFILLDENQSFFKESIGLGFFAGAAIKTQVNNRSEIFLGTRFYFNTLSTSSNLNPIDQRYSFIGIHAGAIYTLF